MSTRRCGQFAACAALASALGDPECASRISLVFEFLNTTLSREVTRSSCSAYSCKEETFGPVSVPSVGVEATF